MLHVETSIVINRPVEEVFAVLSDVGQNPKWTSIFLEATKMSPGPIGAGATWHVVQRALGRRIETDIELTEDEPPRRCAMKSKMGPFLAEVRQTYEPVEGARGSMLSSRQIRAASSSWRSHSSRVLASAV